MSAAAQTKIFGIRVGVDPKILVGGLIVLAGLLFWYNSRGDDQPSGPAAAVRPDSASPASAPLPRRHASVIRRAGAGNDRTTLRLRDIDPTRGDVDPTLRLDLLQRLQSLQMAGNARSLFEAGPAPQDIANLTHIIGPRIPVPPKAPDTQGPGGTAAQVLNIPLKYYGFVKPTGRGEINRGFFLEGESIVIALEGQVINNRYLVVELTPNTARLEDTQMKQGQTLPLVAEALSQ